MWDILVLTVKTMRTLSKPSFFKPLMYLYVYFSASDLIYLTKFFGDRVNVIHLVPKCCRGVQHTLDTQHMFLALFHYDSRL